MKKRIKPIILILILSILFICLINIERFYAYYNNVLGNQYYTKALYKKALSYHTNAAKNLVNPIFDYNIASDFYKEGKFKEALKQIELIGECNGGELCFRFWHNKGNIYYRLGENVSNNQQIEFWQNSINAYEDALLIHQDEQTQANLEFVKEKLKEKEKETKADKDLEQDNQGQSDDNKKSNENNTGGKPNENELSGSQNNEDGKNQSGKEEKGKEKSLSQNNEESGEKNQASSSGGEGEAKEGNGSEGESSSGLSNYEKSVINNYTKQLEDQQKQFQQYYNKKEQGVQNQDPFDAFFNDPFADDPFFKKNIGDDEGNKDW